TVREWPNGHARWLAVLTHGYGEHIGRYNHVAEALHQAGAAVVGPDLQGHGISGGERAVIEDFEDVVTDLYMVTRRALEKYSGLPVILIGHSMGGMIAGRYGQRYGDELTALVLSGPMFGGRGLVEQLLSMDPIPEIPLDPATLSRDPSVGEAYASDPLVWHGAFKRPMLEAMKRELDTIEAGPSYDNLPLLWIHGELDPLIPLAATHPIIEHLRGTNFEEHIYPGALHEIFNETNRDEVIADVVAFVQRMLPL
ncbi:MAG: alpha/beta hydrolase, partial [Ktedonobacteraceae bacterium]|nr:alpha/beta hydrolase [Ktedonobacteraceae bacterium]